MEIVTPLERWQNVNRVVAELNLSGSTARVLNYMAIRDGGRGAWPSVGTIARETRLFPGQRETLVKNSREQGGPAPRRHRRFGRTRAADRHLPGGAEVGNSGKRGFSTEPGFTRGPPGGSPLNP